MYSFKGLSNDRLKIIAVVAMVIDHIGAYLFPQIMLFRIIGRISFPIFAFMIAEGCRYTRNKKRYLLNMAVLSAVCYLLFYTVSSPRFLRIPFTFTISIILVFIYQKFVFVYYNDNSKIKKCFYGMAFLASVMIVYFINRHIVIDYGYYGCITPLIISLAYGGHCEKQNNKGYGTDISKLVMLALALWLVYTSYKGVQIYSFFAIPVLYMYNGKRENIVPKYFFYIFYPLHLAVIFAIKYLILQ